jgi:hypothetical protein
VLKDFHPFLNDPIVIRSLRDLAQQLKTTYTTLILLSPSLTIPVELEKDISVLDVPLPTFDDLKQLLVEIVGVLQKSKRAAVSLQPGQVEQILKAALGLTLSGAENAFAKAIARDNRLDGSDVPLILEETEFLEKAVGTVKSREKTREYYEARQKTKTTIRNR